MIFAKFLRTPFLQNPAGGLLLIVAVSISVKEELRRTEYLILIFIITKTECRYQIESEVK